MEYNENNIFAKILRGEVPCKKIYENDYVLSFEDVNPQKKIHALIIPKKHYIDLDDFNEKATDEEVNGLFRSISIVSKKLKISSLNGKGYVGLGEDYPDFFEDIYSYDPSTNSWTQLDSFPGGARRGAIAFAIGNSAYVGLGLGKGPSGVGSFEELRDLYKYDETSDTWTAMNSTFPKWGTENATVFVANNKAYVLTTSYEFFEYDPAQDLWTELGNFPGETRKFAASFSIGSEGYVATGYDDGGLGSLGDCWKYNATNDNWTKQDTFPGNPRNQAVGFELDGYGVLVGGAGSIAADNEVWVYDKHQDSWNRATNDYSESGIAGGVGFVINNTAYVGTGWVPDGFLGVESNKFHKLTIN